MGRKRKKEVREGGGGGGGGGGGWDERAQVHYALKHEPTYRAMQEEEEEEERETYERWQHISNTLATH